MTTRPLIAISALVLAVAFAGVGCMKATSTAAGAGAAAEAAAKRELRLAIDVDAGIRELPPTRESPADPAWRRRILDETEWMLRARLVGYVGAEVVADGEAFIVRVNAAEDLEKLKQLLTRSGRVEMRFLDDKRNPFASLTLPAGIELKRDTYTTVGGALVKDIHLTADAAHVDALKDLTAPLAAEGVLLGYVEGKWRTYTLEGETVISTADIATANTLPLHEDELPSVLIGLFDRTRFADVTKANVGRRLAIILEGRVLMAPIINEPIVDGFASITMGGPEPVRERYDEALQLEKLLRAGALPAPISIVSVR